MEVKQNELEICNQDRVAVNLRRHTLASQAANILSYLILVSGVFTTALAGYLVVVSYSSLPYWDGWIQIRYGAGLAPSSPLHWLWSQHNDHRLVIPKLFLLADLKWFHANQVFLLVSIFAIQLLLLLLFGWSMRVLGGWRGAVWRTGFGLTAFCLFCLSQWENLTWSFQTCFVLPGLCASVAFVGLLLYWTRSGQRANGWTLWKYVVLSIAGALGAAYSLSNGNLVWPLLVGTALLLRLRRAVVLSFAIAGTLSTALYMHGFVVRSTAFLSPEALVGLCKYVAAYLGSPWVQAQGDVFHLPASAVRTAEVIGIAGLVVFVAVLGKLPSYIRGRCGFCIQLVLTLLFCVGTSAVTAVGRFFFGAGQAFSSRYQTVALLFWCCLALLWLVSIAKAPGNQQEGRLLGRQVVMLAVLVFAGSLATTPMRRARMQAFQRNVAGMALLTDVPDMEQLRWADYPPEGVLPLIPYMRSEHLSVFFRTSPLGKPIDSAFHVSSSADCVGKTEVASAITSAWPRAFRISGWAWDSKDRRPPSEIVITTDSIISGLGAVGDWRPKEKFADSSITDSFVGYTGYVRDVQRSSPVKIYGVLRYKGVEDACYLGTLVPE
jgi:hypothetical protein